jgi:hypothetical protein
MPQSRRFGLRADTKIGVAASRKSAAVFGFLYWRRSAETPLRGDGPRDFFSAITEVTRWAGLPLAGALAF